MHYSTQSKFSPTRPPTAVWRIIFYRPQIVNVLLFAIFFPLPSVRLSKRSPIHVGSMEGLSYHRQSVNAILLSISFSLPTCATVGEESFVWFFGFYCFCFDFSQTAPQAVIFSHFCKSVCELKADLSARRQL